MKKLLLIFLITFSLTGLAKEDYAYSCQVESSGFYDYSNQKRIDLKAAVLHFDIYLEDLAKPDKMYNSKGAHQTLEELKKNNLISYSYFQKSKQRRLNFS